MASQLVVVREIGSARAVAARRHVVGKQPREPEAVVSQMRLQQEATFSRLVLLGQVRHEVDDVGVGLVVVAPEAVMPVVVAELE